MHSGRRLFAAFALLCVAAVALAPTGSAGAAATSGSHGMLPGPALTRPQPPAGANFTTFSASQLARYGLPPRPATDSPSYAGWHVAMATARFEVAGLPGTPSAAEPALLPITAGGHGWAGIVANNQQYYSVQGTWNVPSLSRIDSTSRAAVQWVGLAGVNGNIQLVQAGSAVQTSGGSPTYYSWFEVYPDQPATNAVPLAVSAGDTMFVDISATTTQSYIYMENESTGAYYIVPSQGIAAGCVCETAEAVEEDPGIPYSSTGSWPMAWTNPVNFTNTSASISSGSYWLNQLPYSAFEATDASGNLLAFPFYLQGGGDFNVYRTGND